MEMVRAVTHLKTVKVKKIETVLYAAVGRACHQRGLEAGPCMVDSVIC
jgi:hypothetical protein